MLTQKYKNNTLLELNPDQKNVEYQELHHFVLLWMKLVNSECNSWKHLCVVTEIHWEQQLKLLKIRMGWNWVMGGSELWVEIYYQKHMMYPLCGCACMCVCFTASFDWKYETSWNPLSCLIFFKLLRHTVTVHIICK